MTLGNLLIKLGLRGADDVERGATKAAKSLDRVSDAQEEVSRTSGSASNIVTSFGDAIQDAKFGIAGAANNLSFIAESFADVARTAGGFGAALRSVGSALLGPAGIILALQTALAFLPEIQQALQGASVSSEGLTADLTALGAALFPIRDEIKQLASAVQTALVGAFKGVGGPIKNALGNVVTVVTAAFKIIGQATELLLNILTGDFSGAWDNVVSIVKTALQSVVRLIGRAIDTILAVLQKFTEGIDSLFGTVLSRGADEARASVRGFFNGLTGDLANTERQVVDTAGTIGEALAELGGSLFGSGGAGGDGSGIPDRPRIDEYQPESVTLSGGGSSGGLPAGLAQDARRTGELIDKLYTRAVRRANAVTLAFERIGEKAFLSTTKAVGQTVGQILTLQTEVESVGDAFKEIGKSILQVLQRVIAKLISAVTTAAILSAFKGGFGTIFGGLLGVPGRGGGGGGGAVGAVSGASSLQGIGVTETRLDGRDIALSVTKTQNAQRRKGRTSR